MSQGCTTFELTSGQGVKHLCEPKPPDPAHLREVIGYVDLSISLNSSARRSKNDSSPSSPDNSQSTRCA